MNRVNQIINEKYINTLSSNEINILKTLFESDENIKKETFNSIKTSTVLKLNEMYEGDDDPLIKSTFDKINTMEYNNETVINDIIELIDLV